MKIEIYVTDDNGVKYFAESVLTKVISLKTIKQQKTPQKPKRKSLGNALLDLIDENFFNSPKNLKKISERLEVNAIFYPKTSYPDALLRLIKNKKLRRLKDKNQWIYVKYG